MSNNLLLPITLQLLGVGVIIAEIVLPSGGLLTLIAAGLIGYSLIHVFSHVSLEAGIVFLGVDAVTLPLLVLVGIKMLARSPVTLRKTLSTQAGVASQKPEMDKLVGQTGTIIGPCRPAGRAEIGGQKYDVVSTGDFIVKGCVIFVAEVSGNRIVVKPKIEEDPPESVQPEE